MKDFRKVWERAHELTLELYRMTGRFPREELSGLTSPSTPVYRIHRSELLLKAVVNVETWSSSDSYRSRQAQPMNRTTTYCSLTISISLQGNRIAGDLVHVRKMLTSVLQKVEAERLATKC